VRAFAFAEFATMGNFFPHITVFPAPKLLIRCGSPAARNVLLIPADYAMRKTLVPEQTHDPICYL
jgi:hypothetical protein